MNSKRNAVQIIGLCFIGLAICVFVLSIVACVLIQGNYLGNIPDLIGLIAYFGGPLPIVPAAIASIGLTLLAATMLMKRTEMMGQYRLFD